MSRPPRDPARRRALRAIGLAGAASVAGCLTPSARSEPCPDGTELSLDEASDAHVSNEFSTPVDGLPHASRAVVEDAIAAGDATARGYYSPRPQTAYVVAGPDARYYRVETTDHDPTETTGYEYAVEIDVDRSTLPAEATVHPFGALPAEDRESIRHAIGNAGLVHAPHYTSFAAVFAYEREAVRERSPFVPAADEVYVEWDDTVLRFDFDERRGVRVTSTTVTADRVADSAGEFLEHVGGERGVVLDGLTTDQREIVTAAIDGGYTGCEPYAEPFVGLLDRLSTDDGRHVPLVRYESTWYFARVSRRGD